jgi:Putative auto-transporter adhesin, head GIN domain
MKRILFFSLLLPVILTSCHYFGGRRIQGNGHVTTQVRSVSDFNGIDVSGGIDVYVTQDSAFSVKVEIDDNLQEFIEVYKEGETLRIHQADNTSLNTTSGKIKVYVSAPAYRRLEASGACNIIGQNKLSSTGDLSIDLSGSCDVKMELNAPKVIAGLSGACSIQLKGDTKEFKVEGSGSTDIKCMELLAENVNIDISGAGNAEVYASVKLNVEVSGSGDVKYKGNATVSQSVSGAGSVKKVE